MFTVCPKCTLTLAVTAADLRTGQGYVRCGRCLNVFNALLALSEEPADRSAPTPVYSQADPASSSQITAALASSANDADEFDEVHPARVHVAGDAAPRNHLTTERSSDGAIENESSLADGTGSFETIVLEGDAITQTEEFVPEESIDNEIAALTQRLSVAAHQSEQEFEGFGHLYNESAPADDEALPARTARRSKSEEQQDAAPDPDADGGDIAVARRRAGALGCRLHRARAAAGCFRASITGAMRSPPRLPWVHRWAALYASFGVPLDPHWNLAAYDVRQQGAATDPADSHVIRVRVSVANHAARAQPVPLLRLTLLDRYGKPIAARDLTPAEYWPAGHPARAFLARDERIDSEIAVRDPGADSASFELDVCLQEPATASCVAPATRPAAAAPIP